MWPDLPKPESSYSPYSRTEEVGQSVKGVPIKLIEVGRGTEGVLVFGGFHGDEWQSTYVAERLVDYLIGTRSVLPSRKVVVVPEVNPDGLAVRKRFNANGVDINRNFPTANWCPAGPKSPERHGLRPASEPETQIVRDLIWRYRPKLIVSIHNIHRGRHCVNYDGPAEDLAETMGRCCGYPVKRFLGYATPGSLGTFAGVERNIPTITLEMPRNETAQACWHQTRAALLAAVAYTPEPAPAAAK